MLLCRDVVVLLDRQQRQPVLLLVPNHPQTALGQTRFLAEQIDEFWLSSNRGILDGIGTQIRRRPPNYTWKKFS